MITIHAPYQKTLERIISLNRWKTWWPDSAGTGVTGDTVFYTQDTEYRLDEKQILGLVVTQRNKSVYHLINVTPASSDTISTLHWKRISYLRTAISDKVRALFGSHHYTLQDLLQGIKENLEDPVKYYGFSIRIEPVEDTFVLVKNAFCTPEQLHACILELYSALQQQLNAVHYTGRAEKMLYVDSSGSDSITVMAGFSITKSLVADPPLRMMTMPKAHIVVGDYEGDYKDILRIHTAIIAYMKDHDIEPVAVVYEKMQTDARTAQDSMHVRVKVYHPSLIP